MRTALQTALPFAAILAACAGAVPPVESPEPVQDEPVAEAEEMDANEARLAREDAKNAERRRLAAIDREKREQEENAREQERLEWRAQQKAKYDAETTAIAVDKLAAVMLATDHTLEVASAHVCLLEYSRSVVRDRLAREKAIGETSGVERKRELRAIGETLVDTEAELKATRAAISKQLKKQPVACSGWVQAMAECRGGVQSECKDFRLFDLAWDRAARILDGQAIESAQAPAEAATEDDYASLATARVAAVTAR